MTAAPEPARRSRRDRNRWILDVLPTVAGALILVGGAATPVRPALVVAVAVWVASARPTARLLRMAQRLPADRGADSPRTALLLLAAGTVVTGVCAVGAGAADLIAPHLLVMQVPLPAEIPNVGLFFTVGLFLLGLLLLPGTAPTLVSRLRRVLDGITVGCCVFFIAWVLVFATLGLRGAGLTVTLLGSIAIGSITVAGLRAARHHPIRFAAAAGVIASVTGQVGLTLVLDFPVPPALALLPGVLLVAGPGLLLLGGAAIADQPHRPLRADDDGSFAGYPVLALPLAASILAAAYHFVQQRSFDPTSVVLCIVGVSLVAVREALAAIDVRRYAARLVTQRAHFRSLFAGSTDVTLVLDSELVVRWQSPAAARLLGLSDQDVVGRPLLALLHPDDADQVADRMVSAATAADADDVAIAETRMRDGFDGWRDIELRLTDRRDDPAVRALVAHIRDVGDRKHLERSLRRAAFADQLTTLPNRRELRRAVADRVEPCVVMVLCLDGIAGVNDMHGRAVGDAVLVEAARRLRAAVAEDDVLARLDGEKFAVVTASGAIHAQLLATRLLTTLTEPYAMPATTAYVSGRVGLAERAQDPTGADEPDEVLRRAELALRRAKRRGRGGAVEWHDASVEAVVRRQLAMEQELPGAIERGELELRYQPVVDLIMNRPVGTEAVVSWRHPTLGTIGTDELLLTAEDLGLGPEITEWGVHRACRQLSAWLRDGRDLWMSLDVTAEQLAGPEFVAQMAVAMQTHQVPATSLVIEVAEAGLNPGGAGRGRNVGELDPAADIRAQSIIHSLTELRTLGIRVAVDHFGTAATSFSHLRLLPVDLLKVDRDLITGPVDNTGPATAIIDVMVKFGHQLGVEMVAQGLTDQADADTVRAAGCRYGQGDLLSRPVPAEYLEAYLEQHRTHRF